MVGLKIDFPRLIRALFGQPEPLQQPLKDFETVAELDAWFTLHDELQLGSPNLCDDYSREAMRLAEMDGYFLSTCLVYKGKVWDSVIFALPDGTPDESVYHIANSAIVTSSEEVYYLDLNWNKFMRLCSFKIGGKF